MRFYDLLSGPRLSPGPVNCVSFSLTSGNIHNSRHSVLFLLIILDISFFGFTQFPHLYLLIMLCFFVVVVVVVCLFSSSIFSNVALDSLISVL